MKMGFIIGCILLLVASTVSAANFSPTLLRLSAPAQIKYDFSGSALQIPVTVSGVSANTMFLVYTKDKASTISKVKNGFLGWHYVNKIDTCVYVSPMQTLAVGTNNIKWEGKDKTGGKVAPGSYTYYLWAYDGTNSKAIAIQGTTLSGTGTIITNGPDGKKLGQPVYYAGLTKWAFGNDPMDATLRETTSISATDGTKSKPIPLSADHKYYFINRSTVDYGRMGKYQWVPNGASILDTKWGDNGYTVFHTKTTAYIQSDWALAGDLIVYGRYDQSAKEPVCILAKINQDDGELMQLIDLSDRWFSLEDQNAGAQGNGGPGQLVGRNGKVLMSTFCACYREMIDPTVEDPGEMVIWGNDNGDYVGDHNFEPASKFPWVCFDFMPAPYAYCTDADEHLFSTFGAYDLGAVSFGLIAPDGTGLGYFAFSGETAGIKNGALYVDYGSPYDGMYTDFRASQNKDDQNDTWFIGHDSIKGVITNQVGVTDASPAAFSVAQNTPNPFNPSTTICFTLVRAGRTTVEVYNAAGQKVDAILNANLNAGSHSVVWDAVKHSAGVYFYTVRSGDLTKTMKMTLLK